MAEIKQTMVEALAFVTENGNMSADNLELFTSKYCVKSTRGASSGEPREIVKLYDVDGNVIGRKCSTLHVWLAPEAFNGNVEKMSMCREANKLKTANARTADGIVRDAEAIRLEANELDDPSEKLSKYEEFDAKLEEAKTTRKTEVTVDDVPAEAENFTPFDTIAELAESLGVDVITTKPKVDDGETVDMTEV